jgi:hypothetical protein
MGGKAEKIVKKYGAVVAFAISLCIALGACGGTESDALPQTIRSADNSVSVSVPEGWTQYETEIKDNLALAVQSGSGAYAQIFVYPDLEGKALTARDYVKEAENYYGNAVTGSEDDVTIGGSKGYYFAYKMEVTDEDETVLGTYQGYEYFIAFSGAVVELDIFFSFTDTEPTNDQLSELRDIAQTLRYRG